MQRLRGSRAPGTAALAAALERAASLGEPGGGGDADLAETAREIERALAATGGTEAR